MFSVQNCGVFMKTIMKKVFKSVKTLPVTAMLFISIAVSLSVLTVVQVNCPICSSVATDSLGNSFGNVKIIEVKEELIDYSIVHEWCVPALMKWDYKVDISLVNEGSESLSVPLLLKGSIAQATLDEGMATEQAKSLYAKVSYVEVAGKETKQIQEVVSLLMWGLPEVGGLPGIKFFASTDPESIKMHCPLCRGTQKIALTDWLKEIVQ